MEERETRIRRRRRRLFPGFSGTAGLGVAAAIPGDPNSGMLGKTPRLFREREQIRDLLGIPPESLPKRGREEPGELGSGRDLGRKGRELCAPDPEIPPESRWIPVRDRRCREWGPRNEGSRGHSRSWDRFE